MPFYQLGLDFLETRLDRGILSRLEAKEILGELWQAIVLEDALDERVDVLAASGTDDAELGRVGSRPSMWWRMGV